MLSFFLINDEVRDPVAFVRRLDLKQLSSLLMGEIDVRPYHTLDLFWDALKLRNIFASYFEDFRLDSIQAKEALALFESLGFQKLKEDSPILFEKLRDILRAAVKMGTGLVAICD